MLMLLAVFPAAPHWAALGCVRRVLWLLLAAGAARGGSQQEATRALVQTARGNADVLETVRRLIL